MSGVSALGAFNNALIRFFEDLAETFPEERDIRGGLEAIQGARKINPKLILDLFYEHVYRDLNVAIANEDENLIIGYAKLKISSQFNEMSPALLIFDKYWVGLSELNRIMVWKWLKALCALCEKARGRA
jgi:hypothetical protein